MRKIAALLVLTLFLAFTPVKSAWADGGSPIPVCSPSSCPK